ncbi:MAG: hypothetical protein WC156_15180 [Pedobacter sp.]
MERIKEQIRIATIFTPGRLIKPVWFDWHNRKHTILETTYHWKEHTVAFLVFVCRINIVPEYHPGGSWSRGSCHFMALLFGF